MQSIWKTYVKDEENLKQLLNLILINREAEIAIRKKEGLELYFNLRNDEEELAEYVSNELNNKVTKSSFMPYKTENIFFSNLPRMYFNSYFSFLVETSFMSIKGDVLYVRVENYHARNPITRRRLGSKVRRLLYKARIYSPFLLRSYASKDGKQSLTFNHGFPLIVTGSELVSLVNGSGTDGLLAL